MDELSSLSSTPRTEAEYRAAFNFYMEETQRLLDEMKAEQAEIDHLKEQSLATRARIQSLKAETRAILSRLEAII